MGVTIGNLKAYKRVYEIDHGEQVVFFKFGAEWCIPCVELDKVLVNVENSVIYHVCIDNEDFESFFIENNIYTVPDTIIKYKNVACRFQGLKNKDQIDEIIDNLKKNNH